MTIGSPRVAPMSERASAVIDPSGRRDYELSIHMLRSRKHRRTRLLLARHVLLLVAILLPVRARAQESPSRQAALPATASARSVAPSPPMPRHRARPPERRFGLWDVASTAAVIITYAGVESMHDPTAANMRGPFPVIDTPVRDLLRARTRRGRETAARVGDAFWYVSTGYSLLETATVPLLFDGDPRLSLQIALINVETFAVNTLLTRLPHKTVGRVRPNQIGCATEGRGYDVQCGQPSRFVSFPSGHTSITFAGAGLMCAHHLHGHLYGNRQADGFACGASVTAGVIVETLRVRSDRHWASDCITGMVQGFGIGYGLPTLLYYHPFWRTAPRAEPARTSARPSMVIGGLVLPTPDGVTGVLVGTF
jgi:membrane-associated phospholipid phosphatase